MFEILGLGHHGPPQQEAGKDGVGMLWRDPAADGAAGTVRSDHQFVIEVTPVRGPHPAVSGTKGGGAQASRHKGVDVGWDELDALSNPGWPRRGITALCRRLSRGDRRVLMKTSGTGAALPARDPAESQSVRMRPAGPRSSWAGIGG